MYRPFVALGCVAVLSLLLAAPLHALDDAKVLRTNYTRLEVKKDKALIQWFVQIQSKRAQMASVKAQFLDWRGYALAEDYATVNLKKGRNVISGKQWISKEVFGQFKKIKAVVH